MLKNTWNKCPPCWIIVIGILVAILFKLPILESHWSYVSSCRNVDIPKEIPNKNTVLYCECVKESSWNTSKEQQKEQCIKKNSA